MDYFIKRNTLEKFGPVRTVKPELVFEIGFEGINRSTRHKSGIALRFPRILRWRHDKPKEEADTLDTLRRLFNTVITSPAGKIKFGQKFEFSYFRYSSWLGALGIGL